MGLSWSLCSLFSSKQSLKIETNEVSYWTMYNSFHLSCFDLKSTHYTLLEKDHRLPYVFIMPFLDCQTNYIHKLHKTLSLRSTVHDISSHLLSNHARIDETVMQTICARNGFLLRWKIGLCYILNRLADSELKPVKLKEVHLASALKRFPWYEVTQMSYLFLQTNTRTLQTWLKPDFFLAVPSGL